LVSVDPRSLSFDGVDDYVWVSNSSSLNVTGDQITVALWAKGGPQGNYRYLVGKNNNNGDAGYGLYTGPNGTLRFLVGINNHFNISSETGFVWDNLWHQITAVYNSGTILIYVDGEVINTTNVEVGTITDSTGIDMGIGSIPIVPSFVFSGLIDDVRVCDRALTQEEIQNLAAQTGGLGT
jgi:hypothetical protein